jgi:hypothetical protein
MKRIVLAALLAALASCATTGTTTSTELSPELQSRWNSCEESVGRWCHDHAHGDIAHENECKRDARRGFASVSTEEQRTRYLRDHGCAL